MIFNTSPSRICFCAVSARVPCSPHSWLAVRRFDCGVVVCGSGSGSGSGWFRVHGSGLGLGLGLVDSGGAEE